MDENDHTNETTHAPPPNRETNSRVTAPILDKDRYLPMTAALEIEEIAKREFLQTLWNMLVIVTEHDLEIDPVQILFADQLEFSADSTTNLLDSSQVPKSKKPNAAAAFNAVNAALEES